MSHFLASLGTCHLMLHIHDVENWKSHTQSLLAFWSAGQLSVFRDNSLSKLVFVNKNFSANVSSIYISCVDCSLSLFRCARCFQPYMNIACRSTQNAACTKRTKTLKSKHINKIVIKLKRKSGSKHVLSNTRQLALIFGAWSKVRTSWPYRWFWKIFERFR